MGSNVAPAIYAEFHNLMMAKDFVAAQVINQKLHRLHQDLFIDPSPAPTKYALSLTGRMETDVRLPITPCRESTKDAVRAAMARAGVNAA